MADSNIQEQLEKIVVGDPVFVENNDGVENELLLGSILTIKTLDKRGPKYQDWYVTLEELTRKNNQPFIISRFRLLEREILTVEKHPDGTFSSAIVISCDMLYDEYGAYIGQRQINMIDDHPEAPRFLFFKAKGNEAGQYSLTEQQMKEAKEVDYPNPLAQYMPART